MAKSLVIVESPGKTHSLSRWLGDGYTIEASLGHVVDLPERSLGVRIKDGSFAPTYVVIPRKRKVLEKLRKKAEKASGIIICTDPDREGEMIGYQVAKRIAKGKDVKRVRFNEITKSAVLSAMASPVEVDFNLVDSQQARRILDRIVGYLISPLLPKVFDGRKGLSAGRVQSVALRLICERQREIDSFIPEEHWTIDALLEGKGDSFTAKAHSFKGKKLKITDESQSRRIVKELKGATYRVKSITRKEKRRHPYPSFTTSQLQQQAGNLLHWSSKKTMMIAQQLYEGVKVEGESEAVGLITYHRTDSVRTSGEGIRMARDYISARFGEKYLPTEPNLYKEKKFVQAGHEAIRPTSLKREPDLIKNSLSNDMYHLYRLVFCRFIASQMVPALYDTVSVEITADGYLLKASGSLLKFDGFTKIYDEERKEEDRRLPELEIGEVLKLKKLKGEQHFTKPKPKYTDASLVKALEEEGIGRPSTYAPIISTILEREYVVRIKRRFEPTDLGFKVCDWLVENFSGIMDVKFTASIEERLDRIERGDLDWVTTLKEFFKIFKARLDTVNKYLSEPVPVELRCDKCSAPMVLKRGRYGPYVMCEKGRDHTKVSVVVEADGSIIPKVRHEPKRIGAKCPQCGKDIVERIAKKTKRKFWGCEGYPECRFLTWNNPLEKSEQVARVHREV